MNCQRCNHWRQQHGGEDYADCTHHGCYCPAFVEPNEYNETQARREASARYIASCTAQIAKLQFLYAASPNEELIADKLDEIVERVNWLLEQ